MTGYEGQRRSGQDRLRSGGLQRLNARLRAGGHRIARDEGGNVAMMAGASFFGMALILGGAVDLYRYETQRKRVQAVVDNCVLLGTRIDNGAETIAEVEQLIADCAVKQGVPVTAAEVTVTSTQEEFDNGIRSVEVDHEQDMDTTFLRLASIVDMDINATAAAREQEQYAEISIVLDLSGSMVRSVGNAAEGEEEKRRFDLMRTEVKNFVDGLLSNGGDQTTTINLVPYSGGVNIGRGMFAELEVERNHRYSSCVHVKFNNNDKLRSVKNEVGDLRQLNPRLAGGPTTLHKNVTTEAWVNGKKQYFDHYTPKSDATYTYAGNNNIHWPNNDTSGTIDTEMWTCPDDPHAYMLKSYEPNDLTVTDDGRYFATVNERTYPLYAGGLYNHIVECPAYEGDRCTWTAADLQSYYAGTFEPTLSASSQSPWNFKSEETAQKAFNRGHLGVDGDDASIEYVSNDLERLKERIDNLPVGTATGTDQGMAWAYMLLDPGMNKYIKSAASNDRITVDEDMLDRPRKFATDESLKRGDPALKTRKFIILLTDGQTTGYYEASSKTIPSYYYNGYYGSSKSVSSNEDAVKRVQEVCEKADKKGVEVYTIAFALGDSKTDKEAKAKLVQCAAGDTSATSHSNAYEAGSDLSTVFDTIAASIQRLRLTS